MYIAPNTEIYVCRGIPWTNRYEHTPAFTDNSPRLQYITQRAIRTQSSAYYQREHRDYIRIKMPIGTAQSCNYLAWRNTSFPMTPGYNDARWMYAFITGCEYINNEVTEISYEIDVMQTFFPYADPAAYYFVERETSATDEPGDNLVPEGLQVGDYVNENIITSEDFGTGKNLRNWSVVVACTFHDDSTLSNARGGFYAGTFSGVKYIAFTDTIDCADFLARAVEQNKVSGVVSVFMMPTDFVAESEVPPINPPTAAVKSFTYTVDNTGFDDYTPRNKKLLTYPYSYIVATNNNGNAAEFKIERFASPDTVGFSLTGSMNCNPQIALIPQNYDGFGSNASGPAILGTVADLDSKLIVSGFPQCSFASDSFKAWLAQNSYGLALSGVSGLASIGTGLVSQNPLAAVAGVRQTTNLLADAAQHMTLPPQSHGTDTSGVLAAMRRLEFTIMQRKITKEFAMILDDYFDRYGYKTMRLKHLNLRQRPHWTYIKTINADVKGTFSQEYGAKIAQILDNGITFWRDPDEIGKYSLNNAPRSNSNSN